MKKTSVLIIEDNDHIRESTAELLGLTDSGIGLGLNIVLRYINLMKGRIDRKSTEKYGCHFYNNCISLISHFFIMTKIHNLKF